MTSRYETREMVEAIEGLVRTSGAFGTRPTDLRQALQRLWPGWQVPSLRTVERHLASNPRIMKKPDTGGQRRSHCKHEPWIFGYYVHTSQQGQPASDRG